MPQTLLDRLTGKLPSASKQTLKRMVSAGRVLVNGRAAKKLSQELSEADAVAVLDRPPAVPAPARAARHGLWIVHEDADLLVVNKPAGLLTSTVPGERRPTLLAAVTAYLAEPASTGRTDRHARRPAAGMPPAAQRPRVGLIHRLDRDASGLLVFSANDASYRSLKSQFLRHEVERVYAAVVRGVPNPAAGRIESRLIERADGTVRSTHKHADGQLAVTEYQVLRTDPQRRLALLRVTLHTGRKHQIRAHLSEHGTPILGDPLYQVGEPLGRLLLAAVRLALTHPRTGQRMTFELPPPPEFSDFFPDAADALAGSA